MKMNVNRKSHQIFWGKWTKIISYDFVKQDLQSYLGQKVRIQNQQSVNGARKNL